MIVDAHAHVSNSSFGNVETLLKQLDEAKIDKAILVPGGMLDIRRMSEYIKGKEKPVTLIPPNDIVKSAMNEHPDRFYGFICVNPHENEKAIKMLESGVMKDGYVGLKLAPMVHEFSLTSRTVKMLAKKCGELGVPFYTHTVFSPAAATIKLGMLAEEFPDTNFILGHMGFGPVDIDGFELASRYDNFYLETSGGSYMGIKLAIEKAGPEKLIFGSEFPLQHPGVELKKIEALGLNKKDRNKVLADNILKIIRKSESKL